MSIFLKQFIFISISTIRLTCVFLMVSVGVATACLNTWEEEPLPKGDELRSASERLKQLRESIATLPEKKLEKLNALRKQKKESVPQFEAVAKILSGHVPDAIVLLKELEEKSPGDYRTAANLGTAYELNGELEEAWNWINEGIRRHSHSHHGTEWLHLKILEAKLKLAKDPDWLKNKHVLNGDEPGPVREALFYQLKERLVFVKPPDPVVADLLFLLAQRENASGMYRNSVELIKIANDYGFANPTEWQDALNSAQENYAYQTWRRIMESMKLWAIILIVIMCVSLAVFLWWTRWRRRAASN